MAKLDTVKHSRTYFSRFQKKAWQTHLARLGVIAVQTHADNSAVKNSIDLAGNINKRPAARQMLHSLKSYMQTDDFAPKHILDIKLIRNQLKKNKNN